MRGIVTAEDEGHEGTEQIRNAELGSDIALVAQQGVEPVVRLQPEPRRDDVAHVGGRGGVRAFGLELMGGKDVCNYHSSWADWGNAEDTPVAQPKPKR